jgi:hypothetical protein
MNDSDIKLLYDWSQDELECGNRIKASRINKVFKKYRELRGNTTSINPNGVSHIDNFDAILLLDRLARRTKNDAKSKPSNESDGGTNT